MGNGFKEIPWATHSGILKIANVEIPCYVLETKVRVLAQGELLVAIGRSRTAGVDDRGDSNSAVLPYFLAANNLKPFITKELLSACRSISFHPCNNSVARGYQVDLLSEICDVYIAAFMASALVPSQEHIARQCLLLMRAFARVGIAGLVDEATGFQYVRGDTALEQIANEFIAKELNPWKKTFPDEFYYELCRLRGWKWDPITHWTPGYTAQLTNDLVYDRIAPGILPRLREMSPIIDSGKRANKLHQRLTEDIGNPRLKHHLETLTRFMRAYHSWDNFYHRFNRAFPSYATDTVQNILPISDEDD